MECARCASIVLIRNGFRDRVAVGGSDVLLFLPQCPPFPSPGFLHRQQKLARSSAESWEREVGDPA